MCFWQKNFASPTPNGGVRFYGMLRSELCWFEPISLTGEQIKRG
ncbi:hypothetical protein VII_003781 [Vibrio mimicus MB451]|nr:hypothetical protein VII_003781 [Vibrio mimicus MB451]